MKKNKADQLGKTLVEKVLDKKKIPYKQWEFNWENHDDVAHLKIDEELAVKNRIYKTLALTGNVTGPVIAVVPLSTHVAYKKLAKASGNKKVGMVPLKDLIGITGYEHGANTPVGIHETHPHYPIVLATQALTDEKIIVSSGKLGRSIEIATRDLQQVVNGKIADITEDEATE